MTILSVREVAEILAVDVKLVRREIRLGHLAAFRPGRRAWRVTSDALAEYVRRKEQATRESLVWQ